jgi:cytochrome c-type biogenesis protein CcmE
MSQSENIQPAAVRPSGGRRRLSPKVAGFLAGVLIAIVGTLVVLAVRSSSSGSHHAAATPAAAKPVAQPQWVRPAVTASGLAEKLGVRVTQVAVTGQGGLLDVRFQVIDPSKASSIHAAGSPPALVDEQTGMIVDGLLMSHNHTGAYETGTTYYLLFNNPGNLVQRGEKVSVLLGKVQLEHVAVE